MSFYPTVQFLTYRLVNTVDVPKRLRDTLTLIMCLLPVAIFGCVITCELDYQYLMFLQEGLNLINWFNKSGVSYLIAHQHVHSSDLVINNGLTKNYQGVY